MTVKVTAVDIETGDTEEATIQDGDYILICVDPCYRAGVQVYKGGATHVITVKGRKPE